MQISSLSALQYSGEGAYLVYAAGMPILYTHRGYFANMQGVYGKRRHFMLKGNYQRRKGASALRRKGGGTMTKFTPV